jgi:hypothetical protein
MKSVEAMLICLKFGFPIKKIRQSAELPILYSSEERTAYIARYILAVSAKIKKLKTLLRLSIETKTTLGLILSGWTVP